VQRGIATTIRRVSYVGGFLQIGVFRNILVEFQNMLVVFRNILWSSTYVRVRDYVVAVFRNMWWLSSRSWCSPVHQFPRLPISGLPDVDPVL
jgi:hypothetical protein